jgi:hypothetical protein
MWMSYIAAYWTCKKNMGWNPGGVRCFVSPSSHVVLVKLSHYCHGDDKGKKTSALMGVVSVTPWLRVTPDERTPCTHWTGGWVGLRAGLDRLEEKSFASARDWTPVCSQTLYWLSYSSSAMLVYNVQRILYQSYVFLKDLLPYMRLYHEITLSDVSVAYTFNLMHLPCWYYWLWEFRMELSPFVV